MPPSCELFYDRSNNYDGEKTFKGAIPGGIHDRSSLAARRAAVPCLHCTNVFAQLNWKLLTRCLQRNEPSQVMILRNKQKGNKINNPWEGLQLQ